MYFNGTGEFKSYFKGDKTIKKKSGYKIPARKDNAPTGLSSGLKRQWGYASQPKMFEALWETALKEGKGKVICPFTNINLTSYAERDMSYYLCCFAHILPKGKYPLWKLNPNNVLIVAPLFHKIVDQGRSSDRLEYANWNWDGWDVLVELKKIEYKEWIKLNT